MHKIKLLLPVRDIYITQPFGANYLGFYRKMGLAGHNGIDFRAKTGCPVIAAHSGIVSFSGRDGVGGGVCVIIWNNKECYKTIYYHLKDVNVATNEQIKEGSLIGWADNTGKYTTGDHLHFGLKLTDEKGITINKGNGYRGAINPAPYFKMGRNWDKSNAYHRYGRRRNWWAEYWFRFAPQNIKNRWADSGRYVHRYLKRIGYSSPFLTGEQVNAIIYGGWDLSLVLNPANYYVWGWLKKNEYMGGQQPFNR